MTTIIAIIISLYIVIAFFFSLLVSYNTALLKDSKNVNDERLLKVINDKYASAAIKIGVLITISLYYIMLYRLSGFIIINGSPMNEYLGLLIATVGGTILLLVISIIPVLQVSENRYDIILLGFRNFVLIFKYLLMPISFIYLLVLGILYKTSDNKMTEDDVLDMIEKAESEEGINENESQLIKSVLHFDELKVLDIYTPRVNLVAVEDGMSTEEIISLFKASGFSRLPVYKDTIDEIIGIINHKDFYNLVVIEHRKLNSIIQLPVEVTEYMEVTDLLAMLKNNKAHMAIVKDEYGGTLGVVTMEDILEELVGDIWDEHDKVIETIRQVDVTKYLVKGNAYLDDLIEKLELHELDGDDYVTVNGWVIANLGKIGQVGDRFTYKDLLIKVTNASAKKVLEVLIERKAN